MNMDTNDTNQNGESPQDWDRYASMLREYGERTEVPESLISRQSPEAWERSLLQRQRNRMIRWGLGLPSAMVAFALVGFLGYGILTDDPATGQQPVVRVAEPAPEALEPELFAAPEIPPVWVDSHFDAIELPPVGFLDIEVADSTLHLYPLIDSPVAGE
jgi:hypothetical protein